VSQGVHVVSDSVLTSPLGVSSVTPSVADLRVSDEVEAPTDKGPVKCIDGRSACTPKIGRGR